MGDDEEEDGEDARRTTTTRTRQRGKEKEITRQHSNTEMEGVKRKNLKVSFNLSIKLSFEALI